MPKTDSIHCVYRRMKGLWFGAFVLLVICISVYGVALKVDITNPNPIGRRCLGVWTSPAGKGHKSTKDDQILVQLKESGPSPGIGH